MMFAPSDSPRVFALPPGADFPDLFAAGLRARLADMPPEARARVTILVNSARMRRRIRDCLVAQGPGLLPRIRLVTDPLLFEGAPEHAPPVSPLRRRLELARLVGMLQAAQPKLAPRAAVFDLADSLARLFAEMQAEGVPFQALDRLDLTDHADHWAQAQKFLRLAQTVIAQDAADAEGRLRAQVLALTERWAVAPPRDPVLVVGSTGSRGTTAFLMRAVAALPQGAVVLPGFDFDMPADLWAQLSDAAGAEDHPQFRFHALLGSLGLGPDAVRPWQDSPALPRGALVSLALRPAPQTDQWLREGPALGDLARPTEGLSLIEAPSPRAEATAIAHCLFDAACQGQRAALVTPDRDLTRRVAAALQVWGIVPDDSAGRPLGLSAPGRFLRQVADLFVNRLDVPRLLALLKHPLAHSGAGRGDHLRHTRDLELYLRRRSVPFPDAVVLAAFAPQPGPRRDWAEWLADTIPAEPVQGARPLGICVAQHIALAEALASGAESQGAGALWDEAAGQEARNAMDALAAEAEAGGELTAFDYDALLGTLFAAREVRDPVTAHPDIMIWGTLEARVQGADLVIAAGLNEGVWPKAPDPDPWLNRAMRAQVGLLLPERQIGLSAHDFQQAICAPRVVLSRAKRTAEAKTVPSRWLNRLTNLLAGLPAQGGTEALEAMRARGQHWLDRAAAFEADMRAVPYDPPAPRPAPAPLARPSRLSVTQVETLIRDPYAIYARHLLGLERLNPLQPQPDALLRGTVLHKVLERATDPTNPRPLMEMADVVLQDTVPWRAVRAFWAARLERVAPELEAYLAAQPGAIALREERAGWALPDLPFTLTAKPDRIDAWPDGRVHIIDYKTGSPPSQKQQDQFAKQLLLQALMVQDGAFEALGPREVACVSYLGLGGGALKIVTTPTDAAYLDTVREGFFTLIRTYLDPTQGFAARRAMEKEIYSGDYDHLARFGEWTMQDSSVTIPVGRDDG
ncbi:MAG: double-strand break repair protein AddB [Roseibaca calidilacus]|uniref:Double-strand break repair protein AddB n=1 Tax=Roseibaca calidilacus TaxID=1666912 RepID=A0A0P7YR34_9RHOB|nr:MAG: double-strand break repair protein AddB [Roseibaca calidilacus]CUX82917.1 double-strand break repair protein AddB [Roseibaca calidilacus]